MGIFRVREARALPLSIDPNQITARPYFANYSGELVNEHTAFTSSALTAAVSLLADSVASMPLYAYRDRGTRFERARTPQVLMKPNDHQLVFEFIHELVTSLAIHGVAFIYAPMDSNGFPLELRNINPKKVIIHRKEDGTIFWEIGKKPYERDILQINWMTLPDQLRGISPLEVLRNSVGTMLAIDRFLSQFYGEGATPSSVLETDQQITREQATLIRDTWEEAHWKRRRPAVLTGGLKWRPISASASDMQTMEHREAIIRDIARAYRIPAHLIGARGSDSQTYQNVEQAGINFVRHTLLPWMKRIEDALSQVFPYPMVVRFDANGLQRADIMTRVRAQQIQILSGTMSPNEAREEEGREPYDGGNTFRAPTELPPTGDDPLPPS